MLTFSRGVLPPLRDAEVGGVATHIPLDIWLAEPAHWTRGTVSKENTDGAPAPSPSAVETTERPNMSADGPNRQDSAAVNILDLPGAIHVLLGLLGHLL